jgi:hypothetical protein
MSRRPRINAPFSVRHLMRPSIARMTLDFGFDDISGMNVGGTSERQVVSARSNVALSLRLEELLVFEIREDGYVR